MAGELVLALGALSNAANIAKGMLAVRDANLICVIAAGVKRQHSCT
jgi:hypothetical protein